MAYADPDYPAVAEAVRRGDRTTALNLAARALKRGSRHPLILVLAAEGLEARGHFDPAINLLRAVVAAEPDRRVAWMRLAALQARQRRFAEAGEAFEQVLRLDPNAIPALLGAGEMALMQTDLATAQKHYRRASELAPSAAQPFAILAVIAAQRGDAQSARDLAARAAALEPGIVGAEMALARADILDGPAAPAVERMTRLLESGSLDLDNRVSALDVRASALDSLDRTAEAFDDYAARGALQRQIHGARFRSDAKDNPVLNARRMAAFVEATTPETWREAVGPDQIGGRCARGHAFLVGFPRSGTTLLEKALSGHREVITLEEVNHLAHAIASFRNDEDGWRRVPTLDVSEADACREIYWSGVRGTLGDNLQDKIVLDKLPLHTVYLPFIARLFPDARILFALRDPRDVVLSCFRRRFQVNAAMFDFLTLDGAAEFYDAVMRVGELARARLPLNLREVRHEAVIDHFDAEISEVLAFIGVDWDPAVRSFADRLGGRARTPSYAQLARGLNADGVGQWRRYAAQMQPVLAKLEPWVERFGYSASNLTTITT